MANSALSQNATLAPGTELGQCRFGYTSTSVCTLARFNGRFLFINGTFETIPTAGVTIASSELASNDTTYNIYAYMSGGTMTLEASTTAHSADSTTGAEIKTGDATRALVGKARKTGGNFYDQADIRYVRSWFNDPGLVMLDTYGADSAVGSAPWVQLSSALVVYFLLWAEEGFDVHAGGSFYDAASTAASMYLGIGIDSTTATSGLPSVQSVYGGSSVPYGSQSAFYSTKTLAEGYHYATPLTGKDSGSDPRWFAGYQAISATTTGSGS